MKQLVCHIQMDSAEHVKNLENDGINEYTIFHVSMHLTKHLYVAIVTTII